MAREIDISELSKMIMEEAAKVEADLEKVKPDEVKPDGYAKTLQHKVDWESKLGINPSTSGKKALDEIKKEESKAVRWAKTLKHQRIALQEQIKQEQVRKENLKLKKAIKKLREQA